MTGPSITLTPAHGTSVKKDTIVPITVSVTPIVAPVTVDPLAIAKVEFRINGILKSTVTQAPFVFNFDPTGHAGEIYAIEVTATDNSNNRTTAVSSVRVSGGSNVNLQ